MSPTCYLWSCTVVVTVTVSLTVTRLSGAKELLVVTGSTTALITAGEALFAVGLSVIRGSGIMLIPGSDPLGTEGCAEGGVDASGAGAGSFEGLVDVSDVSRVIGIDKIGAGSVVLCAVVEGAVELEEPILLGVELATATELEDRDELGVILVVVGSNEDVGFVALGMMMFGKLAAPVERLDSEDNFPVCLESVTLP